MDFIFYYTNLIRAIVIILSVVQINKRNYKILIPAAFVIALTFLPWLFDLIDVRINFITLILYQTVLFMAVYLGKGYKYYDLYSWWDRTVHFLSGILFFSFGVTLAEMAPEAGLIGTIAFSFTFSLASHEIWEVIEFLADCIFHTDHQRWQKNSSSVNHQPKQAIQPPGLVDTMTDTISGIIGTAIACIGWWIYLIYG